MFDSDNYARIDNDNTGVCARKGCQRSIKENSTQGLKIDLKRCSISCPLTDKILNTLSNTFIIEVIND